MTTTELDAAGVRDASLRAAYRRCRELNARHGRTYFLATRLLAPAQRPAVHALYGFARWADEIVDDQADGRGPAQRRARLDELAADLAAGFAEGHSRHPVLAAVVDTVARYDIDHTYFADFLTSMRMDTEVTEYRTFAELARYVRGSAEVIGLQVLPVLGTTTDRASAEPYAAALGEAFQLTNFLRDVGEDLDRGRVYLPLDELAAFGVDRARLAACRARGQTDRAVRAALAHLVSRTRATYRRAEPGIAMLAPVSRPCVATAFRLYQGILDGIEAADYRVLEGRVVVPTARRLAVAVPGFARAVLARWR
ncbi:phytoene/squalene synthase family protein [Crossiella equi]|uniref:phytoene/squalene synthase family protein n=1 Tax=Crossiella equi TaxID=130796 RepID=UPI000A391297|nr:phytoene/squalene synthase family protein [Crossiella equi]